MQTIILAMKRAGNTIAVYWPEWAHITGIRSGKIDDAKKAVESCPMTGRWTIYQLSGDALVAVERGEK